LADTAGTIEKGVNMDESITISLPTTMPLTERLSKVNKQLSEWLEALDRPLVIWKDKLKLEKCRRNNGEYIYHYAISRDSQTFITTANPPHNFI